MDKFGALLVFLLATQAVMATPVDQSEQETVGPAAMLKPTHAMNIRRRVTGGFRTKSIKVKKCVAKPPPTTIRGPAYPVSTTTSSAVPSSTAVAGNTAYASTTSSSTYPKEFVDACLNLHNRARTELNAGLTPLAWDDELADHAKTWSIQLLNEKIANPDARLRHSEGGIEGENLYSYFNSGGLLSDSEICNRGVAAFIAEKSAYLADDQPIIGEDGDFHLWGHYTQVVWKRTTKVGCAVASKRGYGQYLTCRYVKPGNVVGRHPYN